MNNRSLPPPGRQSRRREEKIRIVGTAPSNAVMVVSPLSIAGRIADQPRFVGRGSDRAGATSVARCIGGYNSIIITSIIAGAAVSAGPISLAA